MATVTTTTVQGFSLFPSTVPQISVPNPHKKNPSLHRVSVLTAPDAALSPNRESIVIKMEEEPPVPQFPRQLMDRRELTPSPEQIGRAVTTPSPIDGKTPTQVIPSEAAVNYTPSIYQSPVMSHASPQASSSAGTGSATTLVAPPPPAARKSPVDPSPIVPIRSMFPVYDPSVPLTQQAYIPQRPVPTRLSAAALFGAAPRDDYRSSLSMPFITPQRTAPASVLNFPSDVMSIDIGPRISSQRELERLWDASHGTEPATVAKSFDLEMARTEEATFVFGSHPSQPFYTLQTYDTNEIAITKTNPRSKATTQDVVLCPLEPAGRRLPPNDGLVSFIFPKLAAMLAINQSAALARAHNLAPTDRDDIEARAVQRAAKQEACHLRFNARGGFYELEHPAIGRGAVGGDFAIKSPALSASPATTLSVTGKPVLHITIGTDSPLPIITVTDPNNTRNAMNGSTPVASAGTGIRRLSTIPQAETGGDSAGLAKLDLTTQTLHIDANAILELLPSLFSIDCIVSAILAVAVADASTNPAMASMDIWKPRPGGRGHVNSSHNGFPRAPSMTSRRAGSVKSYAGSAFYATIAEREEAEEEAKLMRRTHEADVRSTAGKWGRSKSKAKSRTWFGIKPPHSSDEEAGDEEVGDENDNDNDAEGADEKGISNSKKSGKKTKKSSTKNKKKKIVLREFDLEKLGHYQSGARKGEELPAVTRSALSGLIVGLKLLVWLLTVVVQMLAWVLVNVSRAVTSERF